MKKFTGYAILCLSLIAVMMFIGGSTATAQKPIKRVLVEEATGSWCQFCPRGATNLLKAINDNPDKVIGVAVHNGDGMKLSDEPIFHAAYIGGFPEIVVDRKHFAESDVQDDAKTNGMYDESIHGPVKTQIVTPAKVAVSLENLIYNSANRTMTVDVKATFVATVSGDIRFNVYIAEDSVKGSGQGWDQVNAFDGVNTSPWYKKGNPIKNYYHRHVLRAWLGGPWGEAGVIPSTVQDGGTYTKSYTYKIPNNFDVSKIKVIGIVQMYNSVVEKREVLNAVEQGLLEIKLPSIAVTGSVTEPYLHAATTSKITKKVTFSNSNSTDVTVDIGVDMENSVIPSGWVAKVDPATATIPAGGTFDATVTIETDASFDYAKAIVTATPIVQDAIPVAGSATVYALSEGIKYAVIEGFNYFAKQPFSESMSKMSSIGKQTKIFNWVKDKEILEAFKDQFNVCAISISGGLILGGTADYVTGQPLAADPTLYPDYPNFAKYIKSIMDAGKHILVSVPNGLWLNKQQGAINQDATNFYSMLGVELGKEEKHFTTKTTTEGILYEPTAFIVTGVSNEICSNLTGTGNSAGGYYTYWTNNMKLSPGSKSVPIFTVAEKPTDILGVRYEATNKARVVFLTFDIGAFNNDIISQQIVEKSINWLAEGLIVKPKLPIISNIDDVEFGEVEFMKSSDKTIEITNEGEADLEIKKVEIKGVGASYFKYKAMSLPVTIKPGEKIQITITFTPTIEDEVSATLSITSTDERETTGSELIGKGKKPATSVFTPADQAKTITGLTAGPNPAISKSTISYTISGVAAQVVEMYLVDMRGARVATLVDNLSLAPGSYSVSVNAADLASGSYRVVAHTAVETVQLPLVINR